MSVGDKTPPGECAHRRMVQPVDHGLSTEIGVAQRRSGHSLGVIGDRFHRQSCRLDACFFFVPRRNQSVALYMGRVVG